MPRSLTVAAALGFAALLYSVPVYARITDPWSVSLELGGGYVARTPHNSLSNGGFVETSLSLGYSFQSGVGVLMSAGFLKGFLELDPNPFELDTELMAIPVDFLVFYQYRRGKWQPFVGLGFGYTYWMLDREGLTDSDSPHRLDFLVQGGVYYKLYQSLFVGVLGRFRLPNLFTESERASIWGGLTASALWRF